MDYVQFQIERHNNGVYLANRGFDLRADEILSLSQRNMQLSPNSDAKSKIYCGVAIPHFITARRTTAANRQEILRR